MMSLLAATLVGATAVASVLAVAPYVRRRGPAAPSRVLQVPMPPRPAASAARTLHDELLAELNRPVATPSGCRSRRVRRCRPLSH